MSADETWPRSIRPDQRDQSWNTAMDLMADAFRNVSEGDRVMAVAVVVKDGQGRYWSATRGNRHPAGSEMTGEESAEPAA